MSGSRVADVTPPRRIHRPATVNASVMFDRITFQPQVLGGRACIRGMRIPVSVIVGAIAHGASTAEVLRDHPDLEEQDVRQALEYAAWLTTEEVHSAE